jgi:acyl-CoA synthetase (AMP-forming)/AMP-acid ligase II
MRMETHYDRAQMNLFSLLEHSASRYPAHGAIYCGDIEIRRYAELCDRALRLAAAIGSFGAAGDRIAIAAKNCPEYPEAMFGTWAAGRVAVPVNAKLHPLEVAHIVVDSGAALLFASSELSAPLTAALAATDASPRVIVLGSAEYETLLATEPASPKIAKPEDLAWLFYTSGTTGRPKGAMLSHRNLMAMTIAHLADFECVEPNHSLIHAAPMSHGSGLYMLPYVARGARQIIPVSPSFDPSEVLNLCRVHPGCGMFLAPTMVRRLRIAAEETGARPDNLRSILYGGGPMHIAELKRSLAVFGPVFMQLYGQGEAPVTITGLRREDHATDDESVLGSAGWPRSGTEVAVVDSCGVPLGFGEVGEIVCRGDVVMSGYWNKPQATAETLRDGWLWTGDIGSMQANRRLTLHDRSKDVIISGGTNIYPREVEDALLSHPCVAEVCVVGQPDPEWGENVAAFVVVEANSTLTDQELDAHCSARIARFKRPKFYAYVEALPKSSYGKILKRELAKRFYPKVPD